MKSWFSRRKDKPAVLAPALASGATDAAQQYIAEGQALEDAGHIEQALAHYEKAMAMAPQLAAGPLNRGNAQLLLGQTKAAIASYRQALSLDRRSGPAWLNLGNSLLGFDAPNRVMRDALLAEAEAAYRAALDARPGWSQALFGIACALEARQQTEAACEAYREALQADPDLDQAALNLGDLLAQQQIKLKNPDAARAVLLEYLIRYPGQRGLIGRLANIEKESGRPGECVRLLRPLVAEDPGQVFTHSVMLFALNLVPSISAAEIFEEHCRFGASMESRLLPLLHGRRDASSRPLRIGYFSPDFRRHPVAAFIPPVLRHHDPTRFETYAYYNYADIDEITGRIIESVDHWRHVAGLSDEAMVQKIVDDSIDVLVDLAGHTPGGNLAVFARRAAPVQMTWLGYLGTTGLTRMDYRICDWHSDPPGLGEARHTEQLLRLPHSQWCYEPMDAIPAPGALPRLERGYWTFGSFNNGAKINHEVIAVWAQVLRAIPDSRLRFVAIDTAEFAAAIRQQLAALDIEGSRVDILGRLSMKDYFASCGEVDIALDSFPYSGGTTSCDVLMMGLPVATIAGERTVARSAASLLTTLGLTEWIAQSPDELPALVQRQLADPKRLAVLRESLPARLRASPLMDAAQFTRDLEALYVKAWERHCAAA